jgi:protein associated with RNAse G/E
MGDDEGLLPRPCRIEVVKWGGRPYRSWPGLLIHEEASYRQVVIADGTLTEGLAGGWRSPGVTTHFWSDRWWNFLAGFDRGVLYHYCHVAMPAVFDPDRVTYVDLDLDFEVWGDGHWMIRDENEFTERRQAWGYPPEVVEACFGALADLERRLRVGRWPFDRVSRPLVRSDPPP